jgi:glycosyltransferase involved in cell wall biosynthesis
MMFSIAVPSLNYGRFLRPCLASIAEQDYRDLEVLIADGGSSDDSLAIAEEFVAADPRFRIVSRSDRGQADAVQRAFESSAGDIFGFLNADDVYLRPDALSLVAAEFAGSPPPDVVSFGGVYTDESGAVIKPVRLRRHPLDSLDRLRFRHSVLQPATFWRRQVQAQLPLHREFHYVFDAVFFYEAAQRFQWRERSTPIAGYRLHGENKSTTIRPDRVRELAVFESMKFGVGSFRARYATAVADLIDTLHGSPTLRGLKYPVRVVTNGLSFITAHRFPGI